MIQSFASNGRFDLVPFMFGDSLFWVNNNNNNRYVGFIFTMLVSYKVRQDYDL